MNEDLRELIEKGERIRGAVTAFKAQLEEEIALCEAELKNSKRRQVVAIIAAPSLFLIHRNTQLAAFDLRKADVKQSVQRWVSANNVLVINDPPLRWNVNPKLVEAMYGGAQ